MHGHTWSAALPCLAGALLVAYLWAAARTPRWSAWRTFFWITGCAVLAVSTLSGDDPRGHMAQHLLLGMFAPLGLVLGHPMSLLLRTLPPPKRRTIAKLLGSWPSRVLGYPVTAALLSTGSLYVVFLTPLSTSVGDSPLIHLHYLAAGFLFTWSIAGADISPHRARTAIRVTVLFLSVAAHAILAKYLYAHAAELPLGHHDPDAIRDAAQLMYYGGDIAELLLATALFTFWYKHRSRTRPQQTDRDRHRGLCRELTGNG